jgi:hypothetical protein
MREKYPEYCRRVFRNCDGCLSCNWQGAGVGEGDYDSEKCIRGKGICFGRVNRWTGKRRKSDIEE